MLIRQPRLRHVFAVVCLGGVLAQAGSALASPWVFVGARQQAMGGAGVAFTHDSTATYWNPANLAFQKGWGVNLPVTLGGSIENDALEKLSDLLVGFDVLGATADQVLQCAPTCLPTAVSDAQRQQIARFLARFAEYGQGGENVHVDAALGLAGRYGSFGFSALSLTTGTVFPNTDLENLSLDPTALQSFVGTTLPAPVPQPANTDLATAVQTVSAGALDADESSYFVYLLEQAGANTADPRTQQFVLGLADQAAGSGLFSANDTGALAAGLSTQEFAISWSHKLPVPFFERTRGPVRTVASLVHNKMSLAIAPKYILGVTWIKFIRYDDEEGAGGIVTDLIDIDSSQVSHDFGLDIGLAWRPTNWLRFGMTARNVNSPSFDVEPFFGLLGRPITSIEIEPQVRMGVALVPVESLTIAFDFDATSNTLVTLPGFESRIVSLGAEYAIPFGRHVDLALRLGGYSNVSSTVESDWAMTGGLGLRWGSFHFDLSAGGSFARETIRTGTYEFDDFPTRLHVGLGLSWEKSL